MVLGRCVLVRCSLPVADVEPHVKLPSGGVIHVECLMAWRTRGGALAPIQQKRQGVQDGRA